MSGIPARCHRLDALSIPQQFLAEISSQESFTGKGKSIDIKGRISSDYSHMLHGVLGETSLRLEVSCVVELDRPSKALDQMSSQRQCHLDITLYGPVDLFDEIGSFFEGYEVYLQDPLQSGDHDMRYCNPHRLSSQGLSSCPLLSNFLGRTSHLVGFKAMAHKPDLLDVLSTHDEIEEHPQPRAIQTTLKRSAQGSEWFKGCFTDFECYRHQRQAITFMRLREQGWAFDSARKDIWQATDDHLGLA